MKKLITLEYIKRFKPCQDRLDNYIEHYGNKKFTLVEFLELDKITWKDKKWVLFHENQKLLSDKLLREFAFICASRAVDNCNDEEVNYYFDLVLNIYYSDSLELLEDSEYISADWSAKRLGDTPAYWSADRSADRSAGRSAYWSADRSAYRSAYWLDKENIQKEILVNLIIEELGE